MTTSTPGTPTQTQATSVPRQAAGTAAEETKHVASVAKDESQQVVDEAKAQARHLAGEARTQIEEQSRVQRDHLVGTLRGFTADLDRMTETTDGGMAATLARQVSDGARQVTDRIEGREPAELLDEVRDFARRRPGTFLLGALAAGLVAGRIARGAKDGTSGGTGTGTTPGTPAYDPAGAGPTSGPLSSSDPTTPGTGTGAPLAGTGYPETDPVYPAGSPGLSTPPVTPVAPEDPRGAL